MKISPIAKYITENKLTAVKQPEIDGLVKLYDQAGEYRGYIRKHNMPDLSVISINLYKQNREHPFLKQLIIVKRFIKYFLDERKYMPTHIEIKKTLTDYDNGIISADEQGRGLKQNRYISRIPETDEKLISARRNSNIPPEPVYRLNKQPFEYEFKYHLYTPDKRISEVLFSKRF